MNSGPKALPGDLGAQPRPSFAIALSQAASSQACVRSVARTPTLRALRLDPRQPAPELGDAFTEQAPVGLQLGLTGPPQADAALLALQMGPTPYQAR